MAGRIRADDVVLVREGTNLADLVGEYLELKKAGGTRLKGLCPFHTEKTASFTVDATKGLFHCFGCGEGGDAIAFLEKVEHLSFSEAIERLARRAGIELHYEQAGPARGPGSGQRARLIAANSAAVDYYHRFLIESPEADRARRYLMSRGIDGAAARRFKLGCAPSQWDTLTRELRKQRFTEAELVQAGLAIQGERAHRDRFRGRVLFPVFDATGDPVAFGARVLGTPEKGEPKYLNSPETPVYHKGQVLYALNWAKAEIVKEGFAVIVEGYTDVLALHLAGVPLAVATCGTALGEEHFRLLSRFTRRIVLAFDADRAGERAADRGIAHFDMFGLDVDVVHLPEGQDPADFVGGRGGEAFLDLVHTRSQPLVDAFVDRVMERDYDLRRSEGKARAVHVLAQLIAGLRDPVARIEYVRKVAGRIGVEEHVFAGEVAAARGESSTHTSGASSRGLHARETAAGEPARAAAATPSETARRPAAGPAGTSAQARIEREILKLALQAPQLMVDGVSELAESDFTLPAYRGIFRALVAAGGPGAGIMDVLEAADDDEVRGHIRALAMEELAGTPDEEYAGQNLRRLQEFSLARQIDEAKAELQRLNPLTHGEEHQRRFEELIALEAARRQLRQPVE
ncbi:MAG: DNA primase [Actinomycetota bacterium]